MRIETTRKVATIASIYKKHCLDCVQVGELIDLLLEYPHLWSNRTEAWRTIDRAHRGKLLVNVETHLRKSKYRLAVDFDFNALMPYSVTIQRDIEIVNFIKTQDKGASITAMRANLLSTPLFKGVTKQRLRTRYAYLVKEGVLVVQKVPNVRNLFLYIVKNEGLLRKHENVTPLSLESARCFLDTPCAISRAISRAWKPYL